AFIQSRPQQWMPQVGERLVAIGDGVALGPGAMAQTRDLREDEPHPVALLVPRLQFRQGARVEGVLGIDEALQVRHSNVPLNIERSHRIRWRRSGSWRCAFTLRLHRTDGN